LTAQETKRVAAEYKKKLLESATLKPHLKTVMAFASMLEEDARLRGEEALELTTPFNEAVGGARGGGDDAAGAAERKLGVCREGA
jgi:hypothetical protein